MYVFKRTVVYLISPMFDSTPSKVHLHLANKRNYDIFQITTETRVQLGLEVQFSFWTFMDCEVHSTTFPSKITNIMKYLEHYFQVWLCTRIPQGASKKYRLRHFLPSCPSAFSRKKKFDLVVWLRWPETMPQSTSSEPLWISILTLLLWLLR